MTPRWGKAVSMRWLKAEHRNPSMDYTDWCALIVARSAGYDAAGWKDASTWGRAIRRYAIDWGSKQVGDIIVWATSGWGHIARYAGRINGHEYVLCNNADGGISLIRIDHYRDLGTPFAVDGDDPRIWRAARGVNPSPNPKPKPKPAVQKGITVLPKPYDRVKFRGVTVNRRTKRMILWAEKRAGFELPVAQGSYNAGGVSASAGTHDGGGAVDIGVAGMSASRRTLALNKLKKAGFAAWYRPPLDGVWGPHIHAIAIGDKQLSPGAAAQVRAFDARRDGLAGSQPDLSMRPGRKWSWLLNRPVKR